MRDQIVTLRHLVDRRPLDLKAVSAALDEVRVDAGVEIAVVVAQARRALARPGLR